MCFINSCCKIKIHFHSQTWSFVYYWQFVIRPLLLSKWQITIGLVMAWHKIDAKPLHEPKSGINGIHFQAEIMESRYHPNIYFTFCSLSRMYCLNLFIDLAKILLSSICNHWLTEMWALWACRRSAAVPACGSAANNLCILCHSHISLKVKALNFPWPYVQLSTFSSRWEDTGGKWLTYWRKWSLIQPSLMAAFRAGLLDSLTCLSRRLQENICLMWVDSITRYLRWEILLHKHLSTYTWALLLRYQWLNPLWPSDAI